MQNIYPGSLEWLDKCEIEISEE